jgi:hypothetical protein
MQYSLKTVMWALLALALLFAAPATTLWLVWMLLPTLLVALTLYGRAALRTFAIGTLVGYAAIALQRGGFGVQGSLLDLPLSLVVVGGSGWLMLQLRRWLIGRDTEPAMPPWQEK